MAGCRAGQETRFVVTDTNDPSSRKPSDSHQGNLHYAGRDVIRVPWKSIQELYANSTATMETTWGDAWQDV